MKRRGESGKEWDSALMNAERTRGTHHGTVPGPKRVGQKQHASCFICLDAFRWEPSHGQTWSNITSIIPTIDYTHPDGCKEMKRSCHEAKD